MLILANSLVQHQINSFNEFIENNLQKIIVEQKKIVPDIIPEGSRTIQIKLGSVWVEKPTVFEADGVRRPLTPQEARLRDLTYDAPVMLEMWICRDGVDEEKQAVNIGSIPIMVRSKFCYLHGKTREELIKMGEDPEDLGGYFIINGTERVIVAIEDLAPNRIFVEKSSGTSPYIAKVFSDDGQFKIPHLIEKAKDGMIYVSFTRLKKIPFAVLLKALGFESDKEIMDAISDDENLQLDIYINMYETAEVETKVQAIDYLGKKMGVTQEVLRKKRVVDTLDSFLFPHIGHSEKDRKIKGHLLAKVIKKLLLFSYGKITSDDKDHAKNKRLQLVGESMESLFRFAFKMLAADIKYNFERLVKRGKTPSLVRATRSKLLTSRIGSIIGTGEWVGGRHGVSQHLDRMNFFSALSHLNRVVSPLKTAREAFEARDLHPTQWGRLCAVETPEGPSIGLRKNLAMLSAVSPYPEESESKIIKKLEEHGLRLIE